MIAHARLRWIRLGPAMAALAGALTALTTPASATQFKPLLADTSYRDTDPAPSPDGKWLAFQSSRSGKSQIWLMPTDGGAPRQLTAEPESILVSSPTDSVPKYMSVRAMTPTWAPDGKSLLYISTRGGAYNIYSIPADGGEPRPLSNAPGSQRFAAYSPDGRQIVFPSNRLKPTELFGFNLYVMDSSGEISGPPARQLTFSGGGPGHPVWSPDGKWAAFVAKDFDTTRTVSLGTGVTAKETPMFARFRVFKIPAAGGKETRLSGLTPEKELSEDTWPSWSPDGKWIAFGRNIGGKADLWVVEVATKKAFAITSTGNCMKPTWSYDGKSIYYTTLNGKDEDLWVATDLTLVPPAVTGAKKTGASKTSGAP